MSDPEPDADFRERLLREVPDSDRDRVIGASGKQLDALGRKYDVYRTGVPLDGFDGFEDGGSDDDDAWIRTNSTSNVPRSLHRTPEGGGLSEMSDDDAQPGDLNEVLRLATALAEQMLTSEIPVQSISRPRLTALLGAVQFLDDNDVPLPTAVQEALDKIENT
jgi:hypothetical protein